MRLKRSKKVSVPSRSSSVSIRAILVSGFRLALGRPAVPDAGLGEDPKRGRGVLLELLPQAGNEHPQIVALVQIAVAPDLLEQISVGEQLAGIGHEQLEQGELRRREVDGLSRARHQPS